MIAKTVRTLVMLAASVFLAGARAAVEPGQQAPDFSLRDLSGKVAGLAQFKGKTVVLEWNNPNCPYVQKHYGSGNMQGLQQADRGKTVWLAINSTNAASGDFMSAAALKRWVGDQKSAPTDYLLDPDGSVGRLYGAKTTPHMYIINPQGRVVYVLGFDEQFALTWHIPRQAEAHFDRLAANSGCGREPLDRLDASLARERECRRMRAKRRSLGAGWQRQGQLRLPRNAIVVAFEPAGIDRRRGFRRQIAGRKNQHRQQHVSLVAEACQRPALETLGKRPFNLAGAEPRRHRPGERRRRAGIARIAPVGMPVHIMAHAQAGPERLARHDGGNFADQLDADSPGLGGEDCPLNRNRKPRRHHGKKQPQPARDRNQPSPSR